jgi:hypothetical protein
VTATRRFRLGAFVGLACLGGTSLAADPAGELALTWSPTPRTRALRVLVEKSTPRFFPCPPGEETKPDAHCPSSEGDPGDWWMFRALLIAETGAAPDDAASLARIRVAAARFPGWVEPGTASTEACAPASTTRPAVDVPPTSPLANCGAHGYRVCPVSPKATWVHVAKTYCEQDALVKASYADENGDGIEDASLWIRYPLLSDDEVVGNLTYLDVVDGHTGRILLHGLLAATLDGSDGGTFALTARRTGAGRLRLQPPSKVDHEAEVRLRREYPGFLAPGTYVLGPSGYHRTGGK